MNLDEHFISRMNLGKKKAIKEVKIAILIDLLLILYCFCWACYDHGWTLFWSLATFILLFTVGIIWIRQNFYLGWNETKYRDALLFSKMQNKQKP